MMIGVKSIKEVLTMYQWPCNYFTYGVKYFLSYPGQKLLISAIIYPSSGQISKGEEAFF